MKQIWIFRKGAHPQVKGGVQKYEPTDKADTLNIFDNTETRTPILIVEQKDEDEDINRKKIF